VVRAERFKARIQNTSRRGRLGRHNCPRSGRYWQGYFAGGTPRAV
jgi:hypothetical protein